MRTAMRYGSTCRTSFPNRQETMGWQKFRRTDGQVADSRSLVTLRPKTIAFNAHFIRANGLQDKTRVTVHVDPDRFRVGFQFHSDVADQDSFALTGDGGSSTGHGRAIQVSGLMQRYRWLNAAAAVANPTVRRYSPEWLPAERLWILKSDHRSRFAFPPRKISKLAFSGFIDTCSKTKLSTSAVVKYAVAAGARNGMRGTTI